MRSIILVSASTLALLTFSSRASLAVIVDFTFQDTVSFSTIPNAAAGDPITVVFQFDNGGTSLLAQTWSIDDAVGATVDVNSGAYTATWDLPVLLFASATTDILGNVTSIYYSDDSTIPDSNGIALPEILVNENRDIIFAGSSGATYIETVSPTSPSNWTASSPAIPEPSTFIIWSLLGALAITVGWWRRRRAA